MSARGHPAKRVRAKKMTPVCAEAGSSDGSDSKWGSFKLITYFTAMQGHGFDPYGQDQKSRTFDLLCSK